MNKQIQCVICGREFRPRHWHTICCYDSECREIYKEQQRISRNKQSEEWRKKNYHGRCRRCNRRMEGKGLCGNCIGILDTIYADASMGEDGVSPGDLSLHVPTPQMIY